MPEPLVIADPGLSTPADRTYWTTPAMLDARGRPKFTVGEVAKFFFGCSSAWVRWQLGLAVMVDGERFDTLRTPANARYFRLWDIERWAHGLAQSGAIEGRQLELVVSAVKTNAQLYRFIA